MTYVQQNDGVRMVVIEAEPEAACEYCKQVAELRPYGKNGERICFDCAMKPENKRDAEFMFKRRILGGCR